MPGYSTISEILSLLFNNNRLSQSSRSPFIQSSPHIELVTMDTTRCIKIKINTGTTCSFEYADTLQSTNCPGNPEISVHINTEEPCLLSGAYVPGSHYIEMMISGHANLIDFVSAFLDGEYCPEWAKSNGFYDFYTNLLTPGPGCPIGEIYLDNYAIAPSKTYGSDVGYDLTIVSEFKRFSSNSCLYETGVRVVPPKGYYYQVVPRSSLSKSGYILSNSIAIIDPGYTGTIKIALTRVDTELPELSLPFRCAQLVLAPFIHCRLMTSRVKLSTDQTARSDGAFGSTG